MTALEKYGRLSVKGRYLTDKDGNVVQLRGISTHNIGIYPEYINEKAFKQFADEYKVSIMRLAMYSGFADDMNGYADSDDAHRKELEELILKGVKICNDLGIYCLVDWHILLDYDPNMHTDAAVKFFENIALKLKNYDNVIYEICNEPNMNLETNEKTTWDMIKNYARKVIRVIREIDPSKVIIVGTPTWSQDVDIASESPLEYDNIMYTLHFYAESHRDPIRDKLKEALKKELPIFVTEFGVGHADGNGTINDEQTDIWMKLLNENNISYIIWNLSNKNETSSILTPECTKICDFTDEDLSECGKRMKVLMSL